MRLKWLPASRRDLQRLYDFLFGVNPLAAARRIDQILDTTEKLLDQPRLGHVLEGMQPNDVRAWIVGDYEVRYEIDGDTIVILRIWHTREDR